MLTRVFSLVCLISKKQIIVGNFGTQRAKNKWGFAILEFKNSSPFADCTVFDLTLTHLACIAKCPGFFKQSSNVEFNNGNRMANDGRDGRTSPPSPIASHREPHHYKQPLPRPRPGLISSTMLGYASDTLAVYNHGMAEEWLTTAEVAELSGYHPERIRELVRAGKIYGRKFGTVWQIAEPSLLVFLEEVRESGDKRRGPKS